MSRQFAVRTQSNLDGLGSVQGVTQLSGETYVVCTGSNVIELFDSSGKRLKGIPVEGLKDPHDIVASRKDRTIYVADCWPNQCIWRVTANRDVALFLANVEPWSLSVTSRRLLVTSHYDNVLLLVGANGEQLQQVSLPDEMVAWHAVETDNRTFVVSHGGQKHAVSEVSVDGHVIRVCGEQLGWPLHLAVDAHYRVFVADYDNHRVVLLNKQLQLERVLPDSDRDELKWPQRLCYVPETGHLLVGEDVHPGRFNVYK